MRNRITVGEFLHKQWLLVAILITIIVASINPKLGAREGPLRPEYTVKYGAVSLIFAISGLSLKTHNLLETITRFRLHLVVQGFTFALIPIYVQILVKIFGWIGLNEWVLKGLITVACMPPPVSSAVILTKAAGGSETVAIFNSVLGSFLGIIITPVSLLFNLGFTSIVPLMSTVLQLITTVLVPLIAGQIVRNYTGIKSYLHSIPLSVISQLALLLVIFTTFCDTFIQPETGLTASDILVTVLLVTLLQISLLIISFHFAQYFRGFERADIVAMIFCSTHKSLTLGIPILRIMFHGYAHLSQITLPLLVYHPMQIMLGSMCVTHLKEWASSHDGFKNRGHRKPV